MADLIVSFHVGFIATYNLRKVLVMNGRLIARFYVRHVSGWRWIEGGRARRGGGGSQNRSRAGTLVDSNLSS